ncbi:MAG: putative lipid II flippase FtsW [Planctomycetes bacterium]|nr:putative lipid II flippase FtsW [Planctomycetota bacterium]
MDSHILDHHTSRNRGLFIALTCVLLGVGVLMVYSAGMTSWPTDYEEILISRHLLFLTIGVAMASAAAVAPARFWFRIAPLLFAGTACLLVLVLIPGVGTRINGARRWLRFGAASLQPSELAKIALPLFVARLLYERRDRFRDWIAGTIPLLFPAAVIVPLVILQPDLGTGLFLAGGCSVTLFVGGWPIRYFAVGAVILVPACLFLISMKPYQVERITGFLAAWSDADDAPYQMKQSLVSLGAGGIDGVGLGKGWQKLSFLPEANTDFVFAVVGEELGLLGTCGFVTVWTALFLIGWRLMRRLDRRSFEFMAAFTLLMQVVFQAAINVAVVTAMVPPKGIPHPLISYGGSNLVVSLVSLGIVLSLTRPQAELGAFPAIVL